ncbi:hypothetical protein [Pseudonocardia sp. WMMC193]|uniref:hypothetical protein n=1 Tax=Pseudonocardia sp. WMMC193 TaxID=2911965 RepID=UPI001F205304|nr:hypothetical protein [Pseudonocardia sp. WMMC193]MCF7553759.1 hypothetical protein [Pseudonocardia sp. WMMC193]
MLTIDAVVLVRHAQAVLAAAVHHDLIRGASEFAVRASLGLHPDQALPCAETRLKSCSAEVIDDLLFELDSWVRRHHEPDEPVPPRQAVTDAVITHL